MQLCLRSLRETKTTIEISSLIVDFVNILVDMEASAVAAQKDKGITSKMAAKAQERFVHPAMTKLLRTRMTFAVDTSNFSKISLEKIIICKNNSMRIPPSTTFDAPILKSGWSKSGNNLFL